MRLLVVDASALVDLLLRTPQAGAFGQTLTHPEADLATADRRLARTAESLGVSCLTA